MFGLVAAWLLWSYSRLQNDHGQIREGWNRIVTRLRSRRALVPALVDCIAGHQVPEQRLLDALMRESHSPIDESGVREICRAEKALTRELGKLAGLVRRYPGLKADPRFCDLMAKLVEIEDDIRTCRRCYNAAAQLLNRTIDSFPGHVLANLFFILKVERVELEIGTDNFPKVVREALRARCRTLDERIRKDGGRG
jgi:hypothetical protein